MFDILIYAPTEGSVGDDAKQISSAGAAEIS
jgi:hypothetical protein